MDVKKLLTVAFIGALVLVYATGALSAVTIEPRKASTLKGFTVTFRVAGLDPNGSYTYVVKDEAGGILEQGDITVDANGEGAFTVTFDQAGTFYVYVKDGAGNIVASASVEVIDLIGILMPVLMLIISLTVVFGVIQAIQKELKF